MKLLLFLCGITACLAASNDFETMDIDDNTEQKQDISDLQIQSALATAQRALNEYQRSAPQQEYQTMLAYLQYYRSWYQSVTPAPIRLVERLSPAALKFIAQLKSIAQNLTQAPPRGLVGASRLTPEGEQFYQKVIAMAQSQLIEGKRASIMIIPHIQSRLV